MSETTQTKVQAMPTITIAGGAVILTSSLKLDTIKKMEKYNPKALCLSETKNDEEIEIFRIMSGEVASVSKCGVVFNETDKQNGNAIATILLPEGITDKKAWVKDNFANVMFMLRDLEAVVKTACANLEAAYTDLDKYIKEI